MGGKCFRAYVTVETLYLALFRASYENWLGLEGRNGLKIECVLLRKADS